MSIDRHRNRLDRLSFFQVPSTSARRAEASTDGIAAVGLLVVEPERVPDRERVGRHGKQSGVPRAARTLTLAALAMKRKLRVSRGFVTDRAARAAALKSD